MLIQCILQFLYDIHWLTSYSPINQEITTEKICDWLGILVMTVYNLGLFYSTVLGIEIIIKFKNIGNIAYYKRSLVYHIASIGTALAIDVLLYAFGGYGVSNIKTCSINSNFGIILEYFPRTICMFTMLFTVFYLMKNLSKNYSKIIINYYFIIFFVVLCWTVPSFIILLAGKFDLPFLSVTGYFLGTLSGTLIGMARLLDAKLFREIYKKFLNSEQKEKYLRQRFSYGVKRAVTTSSVTESLLTEPRKGTLSINCFGDLFESMSKRVKNI